MKTIEEILCGVYKITSPSGRMYIGQSVNIEKRFKWYKRCLNRKGNGQPQLYRSFRKYGVEKHLFEIVCLCSVEELYAKEMYFIDELKTYNNEFGLNCTMGGDGMRGFVFSEQSRKKMSESAKRSTVRYMLGKKLSPETRKKISDKNRGRKESVEMREKKRETMLSYWGKRNINGKTVFSEERKRKMSETRMGVSLPETQKQNMKEAWERRKADGRGNHSEETKEKTRQSIKEHWVKRRESGMDKRSKESRLKTSESLKKNWANRKLKKAV